MPNFFKSVSVMALALVATSASAGTLQTAVGKTNLSVTDCAQKALDAFTFLGIENAQATENLQDWKPAENSNSSGSISVFGGADGESASVMCRPFETDLVVFVTSDSESIVSASALWDAFYN